MAKSKSKHKPDSITGPASVAVVNNDPDACEVVARVLEGAGHRVARIGDPDSALRALAEEPPAAVVIDLVASPHQAGLTLLGNFRNHSNEDLSGVRAVVIGAQAGDALFSWHSGADGFLVRPFHADALVAALAEALARPEKDRVQFRKAAHQAELAQPSQ